MRKAIAGVIGFVVFACNGTLNPPEGPGTEYPCGVRGVVCTTTPLACCPENHICGFAGGFSRCEPGYCCFDGDSDPHRATPDAGPLASHPPVRQSLKAP